MLRRNDRTLLFMPSGDGIGHCGKMLLIARALREKLDARVEFAGNGPYGALFPQAGFTYYEVDGGFAHNRLRFLYTKWTVLQLASFLREGKGTLRRVIEAELELYKRVQPELIVWDGRFTVPMSAWVAGLPFVSVLHPYLTPFSALTQVLPRNLPLLVRYPWLGFVTRLPERLQGPLARGFWHTLHGLLLRLYNSLVRDFGASPAGSLAEVLERSEAVIFPDSELTAPTVNRPQHCYYSGPLAWQPDGAIPASLQDLHDCIYVTMGSSGNPQAFKHIMTSCPQLPPAPIVMTLGQLVTPADLGPLPQNVYVYDYLPGAELAKRARLMICQAGGPTVYQALSHGVPIIGIPFNIPQEMIVNRIEALGAGLKLYANELTPARIARTVSEVYTQPRYRTAAVNIGAQLNLDAAPQRAADIILGVLEKGSPRRRT